MIDKVYAVCKCIGGYYQGDTCGGLLDKPCSVSSSKCIDVPGPFGEKFCKELDPAGGGTGVLTTFAGIISKAIGVITIVAGLWFFFQLIIAAFSWITSGGDAQKISDAQSRIINALIGLTLVVAAIAIMALVSKFFGIDFLLTKPEDLSREIAP